ncbi:ATP-binding protein [Roseomonas sp. GC11]|nr:ATP-binding protein [Roseomonas sp. GC11]
MTHVSANMPPEWLRLPGRGLLAKFLPPEAWAAIQQGMPLAGDGRLVLEPALPWPAPLYGHHVVLHRAGEKIWVLEIEWRAPQDGAVPVLLPAVQAACDQIHAAPSPEAMCAAAAAALRRITGFDRVLVYEFDAEGTGTVLAEDRNDSLPSYVGLSFPASDIPPPARRLYERNVMRLIPDAGYEAVPLCAAPGSAPLDLSFSALRSVADVHRTYMRNMGTAASMSFSLLRQQRLAGMISCHAARPLHPPAESRSAALLVSQILAARLNTWHEVSHTREISRLTRVLHQLLLKLTEAEHFIFGLRETPDLLLGLCEASGAVLHFDGSSHAIGRGPPPEVVAGIIAWLWEGREQTVFHSDRLGQACLAAAGCAEACGLIALSLSSLRPAYLLWFRPEWPMLLHWSGEPVKQPGATPGEGPSPRHSFETWREMVRGRARPWSDAQIEIAQECRHALLRIIFRHAEERAALAEELAEENRELTAFSYSISHDLRAPFRHISGFASLLEDEERERMSPRSAQYVATIRRAAHHAGQLVDALLRFAQIGHMQMSRMEVSMAALVEEARQDLEMATPPLGAPQRLLQRPPQPPPPPVQWSIGPLPSLAVDPILFRQVWANLLANALKYSAQAGQPRITVHHTTARAEHVFRVSDNGVGFDMRYAGKLFNVFQRLHRADEYEGIGIGLAIVRRILERHGGRIWAESQPGGGASFFFALPLDQEPPA